MDHFWYQYHVIVLDTGSVLYESELHIMAQVRFKTVSLNFTALLFIAPNKTPWQTMLDQG